MADQVLKKIDYSEYDLIDLTLYRPELTEFYGEFFNVIEKVKNPEYQEMTVMRGVINLFDAKKYDSVISLINALEKRTFNDRNLKGAAIREAFEMGAFRGITYFVEEFHENLAVTSETYAYGLIGSWRLDKSKVAFPFLLSQADQGDLGKVGQTKRYGRDTEFRDAIDKAWKTAQPAGSRHARFFGKVKIAIITLNDLMSTGAWTQEPGSIIASYLLGDGEGTKVMKEMRQESTKQESVSSSEQDKEVVD
jgi:hypothetical protein